MTAILSLVAIHHPARRMGASRPYFLRGLRVKNAVLGSREGREGKKSAKRLLSLTQQAMKKPSPVSSTGRRLNP
jgi:hypothetical protein